VAAGPASRRLLEISQRDADLRRDRAGDLRGVPGRGYGFIDTVTEQTSAYRVLQPPAFVNQYAAVPSLHFGWNLLMGIALVGLSGHWLLRLFGWLMPAAMLVSIVLTANHYIFDGLVGGVIALLGLFVATRLARSQARRLPPAKPPVVERPAAERGDQPCG
jgi:membrane-associated phospholipid phosphatase